LSCRTSEKIRRSQKVALDFTLKIGKALTAQKNLTLCEFDHESTPSASHVLATVASCFDHMWFCSHRAILRLRRLDFLL
jgi:hypothetical protein